MNITSVNTPEYPKKTDTEYKSKINGKEINYTKMEKHKTVKVLEGTIVYESLEEDSKLMWTFKEEAVVCKFAYTDNGYMLIDYPLQGFIKE